MGGQGRRQPQNTKVLPTQSQKSRAIELQVHTILFLVCYTPSAIFQETRNMLGPKKVVCYSFAQVGYSKLLRKHIYAASWYSKLQRTSFNAPPSFSFPALCVAGHS